MQPEPNHHLSLIRAAAENRGTATEVSGVEIAFVNLFDGSVLAVLAGSDWRGYGADWRRSARFWSVEWPRRGRCHAGYRDGALGLFGDPIVIERIDGKPIHVAGYSLGGSVGEGLALLVHESGGDVRSVTTYGAPAWFKPGFAWPQEVPRTRYVCGWDPVPRMVFPTYWHQVPPTYLHTDRGPLTGTLLDHRLENYENGSTN